MPIEQDRPHGDPVKTEYGKGQGTALVEPDEEAVELRSITLNSSRWSQIKESFKKAMEPKGVKVLRWYLCMPREMQKEDIEKWDKFKEENERKFSDVELRYIDGNEKSGLNGELMSKKYVRASHHFYIMLGMTINIYGNLMLSLRDIDINSYTDTKLFKVMAKVKFDVEDAFGRILKDSLKYLVSSYLNPVAIIHTTSIYGGKIGAYGSFARDSYAIIQLNSTLSMFSKYIKSNSPDRYNVRDNIDRLFEGYYKAGKFKLIPKNEPVLCSYNTPELLTKFRNVIYDKNSGEITTREPTTENIETLIKTIYNNFVKSGLVSLESSDGYF